MPPSQHYEIRVGDLVHDVVVVHAPGSLAPVITVDGLVCVFEPCTTGGQYQVGTQAADGANDGKHAVHVEEIRHGASTATSLRALVRGQTVAVQLERSRAVHLRRALSGDSGGASDGTLVAPMPGRVVQILVKQGQLVRVGTPMLIIEAMKMENELHAPCAGTVDLIAVACGDAVEAGERLCSILKPPAE